MSVGIDDGAAAAPDPVGHLTRRAASWLGDAMDAWYRNDHDKVAALAPLAVELLGKAVLWRRHPALLVPLSQDAETSLISLITEPNLTAAGLRTIGLTTVLSRLERLLGLPVEASRRRRLVEVRNGAVHVGASATARHVLLDALRLCRELTGHLEVSFDRWCGDHLDAIQHLLDEQQSEVARQVAAKRTQAARVVTSMEHWAGPDQVSSMVQRLESERWAALALTDAGDRHDLCAQRCPACTRAGCLTGRSEATLINESDGYFQYDVAFTPQGFACNVCRLRLSGSDELAEAGLPHKPFRPLGQDLPPDFDPFDF